MLLLIFYVNKQQHKLSAKMSQVAVGGSQKGLSQTKETLLKSYQKRLKDDIKSMVDNYVEIIKLGKVYCFDL